MQALMACRSQFVSVLVFLLAAPICHADNLLENMGKAWATQQQQAAALHLRAAEATAPLTVTIKLHALNVVLILFVLLFAILGAVFVWQWFARPRCTCPLCEGQYELVRRLGAGGFGMVFLLIKPLPDDAPGAGANPTTGGLPLHLPAGEARERFVLKLIPVDDLAEASTAQIEARDLRALRHPGVVHYHEDFIHFTRRGVDSVPQMYVAIVMEHCEMDARTFVSRVAARRELIPEHVCVNIAAQLVRAVAYCHAQNVVHRDIKSQNVFLTQDGSVRLGDFGLAREVQQHLTSHTDAGTDCYKPPEALTGSRRDARAGDVWGIGLFLLELLSRRFMWQRDEILAAAVLQHGRKAVRDIMAELPRNVYGYDLLLLVKECLHPNPASRPTAAQLAERPVLKTAARARGSQALTKQRHNTPAGWDQHTWQTVSPRHQVGDSPPAPSSQVHPPPGRSGGQKDRHSRQPHRQSSHQTSGMDVGRAISPPQSHTSGRAPTYQQPWIRQDGSLDLSALTPEHDGDSGNGSAASSGTHSSDSGSTGSARVSDDDAASASASTSPASSTAGRQVSETRHLGESARSTGGGAAAGHLVSPERSQGGWQRVTRRRKRGR